MFDARGINKKQYLHNSEGSTQSYVMCTFPYLLEQPLKHQYMFQALAPIFQQFGRCFGPSCYCCLLLIWHSLFISTVATTVISWNSKFLRNLYFLAHKTPLLLLASWAPHLQQLCVVTIFSFLANSDNLKYSLSAVSWCDKEHFFIWMSSVFARLYFP
jgi:hypothetical protein